VVGHTPELHGHPGVMDKLKGCRKEANPRRVEESLKVRHKVGDKPTCEVRTGQGVSTASEFTLTGVAAGVQLSQTQRTNYQSRRSGPHHVSSMVHNHESFLALLRELRSNAHNPRMSELR
jgi:hypothetical protein